MTISSLKNWSKQYNLNKSHVLSCLGSIILSVKKKNTPQSVCSNAASLHYLFPRLFVYVFILTFIHLQIIFGHKYEYKCQYIRDFS